MKASPPSPCYPISEAGSSIQKRLIKLKSSFILLQSHLNLNFLKLIFVHVLIEAQILSLVCGNFLHKWLLYISRHIAILLI